MGFKISDPSALAEMMGTYSVVRSIEANQQGFAHDLAVQAIRSINEVAYRTAYQMQVGTSRMYNNNLQYLGQALQTNVTLSGSSQQLVDQLHATAKSVIKHFGRELRLALGKVNLLDRQGQIQHRYADYLENQLSELMLLQTTKGTVLSETAATPPIESATLTREVSTRIHDEIARGMVEDLEARFSGSKLVDDVDSQVMKLQRASFVETAANQTIDMVRSSIAGLRTPMERFDEDRAQSIVRDLSYIVLGRVPEWLETALADNLHPRLTIEIAQGLQQQLGEVTRKLAGFARQASEPLPQGEGLS